MASDPTVVPTSRPPSSSDRTVVQSEQPRTGSEPTLAPGGPCHAVPSAPGRSIGRYELISELGHGGMGVVWKARDTQLQRIVALKVILSAGDAQADQVERFMREAQAAARLRHPNIVGVHDVGVADGQHYFTCDYIAGRPLDAIEKPLPARRAMEIVKAVADALQYAHDEGIVHRDVKPGNILVDASGKPYVMDFGLAKDVKQTTRAGLTMSGDLLGTPAYMSPEQARGLAKDLGPASDQFSLGAVLYELLTGVRPFDGESLHSLFEAILERDPVRPTSINPKTQRDVETICLKALDKDPSRRYATIGDLAADAGRWLAGEPIEARPISGMRRLLRKAAKHRWVVLPTCAAVLVGVVLGAYALVASRRTSRAEETASSALDALEKSRRVSAVFARWARLLPALGRMEAVAFDSTTAPADVERLTADDWRQVQEFIDATPPDSASQATMRALAGWARAPRVAARRGRSGPREPPHSTPRSRTATSWLLSRSSATMWSSSGSRTASRRSSGSNSSGPPPRRRPTSRSGDGWRSSSPARRGRRCGAAKARRTSRTRLRGRALSGRARSRRPRPRSRRRSDRQTCARSRRGCSSRARRRGTA